MEWTRVNVDRWRVVQPDDSTNYILRRGGRLLELHVSAQMATLHEYAGVVGDEEAPLASARHLRSTEAAALAGCDEATAWRVLAQHA